MMQSRAALCLGLLVLGLYGCGCGTAEEVAEGPFPDENQPPGLENGPSGGVCGFTLLPPSAPRGSDGFVEFPASHPSIFYYGRIDCSDPQAPAFALPAVTIRIRFVGDAVELRLQDFGRGGAQSTNYYDVVVDGGAAVRLMVAPEVSTYPLAAGLVDGVHTVEITKLTESGGGSGKGVLRGVRVHGTAKLLSTRPRAHRIELIGDSITAGYGNEISTCTPSDSHFTTAGSNARRAFGAAAARALDADYMTVAYSGRGVYRNYGDQPGLPVPALYLETLPDDADAADWVPARAVAEVVVLNLGTNDFSSGGGDHEKFKAAYAAFLQQLRGYYPQALFVLAAGPMLSDSYPPGELAWTRIREDLESVASQRRQAGDALLRTIFFAPQTGPWGQDSHPTIATHARMAAELVELVRAAAGF